MFVTAGLYAVDRLVRAFRDATTARTATLVNVKGTAAGGRVLQVRIPKRRSLRWLTPSAPGQFAIVYIPTAAAVEAHPFSLTSAPADDYYEVHIRDLGDYTRALIARQEQRGVPPFTATIEGPYGSVGLRYSAYPVIVLVAGGIGITPVIGILKDIYRDTRLTGPTTAYMVRHVHVVWSMPTFSQFGWFCHEFQTACALAEAIDGRGAGAGAARRPLPQLHVTIYATKQGGAPNPYESFAVRAARADLTFAQGRPNLRASLAAATSGTGTHGQMFVFACGPAPMVRETWDNATVLRRHNHSVHFHRETFEL